MKAKILIVEDEKEIAKSVAEYLVQENFVCERAADFNSALEKLELYNYDCAVVDIMLPDGNGLQLVKYLKDLMRWIIKRLMVEYLLCIYMQGKTILKII